MRKYITTDKHPELKEGVVLTRQHHGDYTFFLVDKLCTVENGHIADWIQNKFAVELQEKEFTRNDMEKAFEAGRRMEESPLIYTYGCAEDYFDTLNKDTKN